jgi:hypothetical protein
LESSAKVNKFTGSWAAGDIEMVMTDVEATTAEGWVWLMGANKISKLSQEAM